ncbi:MAG: Cell wall assembly regulator [Geoglossum umbratile]|nr:MAG: Cell wall assembly regulator [Geoglossum umbratile]
MAYSSIGSTWRSFWHVMTSYDRHASHDSPYRTGQPLNSGRHAPLTSVATGAVDSRQDLHSAYSDEPNRRPTAALHGGANGFAGPPAGSASPYAPGTRSASLRTHASENNRKPGAGPGEIPLQNFSDGLPPPPPVPHSWKRIDRWAEDNYPELFDQLAEGATINDINELEHELDCSLPMDVRESLQIHDGQERGGLPSGIIFGCMLLDCEEIVQEWSNWRLVNQEYLSEPARPQTQSPSKAFGSNPASSSSPQPRQQQQQQGNPLWRQELLAKQDSQPPDAIQKAYAHPGWIPLVRDWGGNNLAIDLAPGPAGKWGQVILFGRDYDCKYVVARSWAALLATVADDLGTEKWFVNEDTGELKLREFKSTSIEPGYFDILRWRTDQKYGRKGPKRKQTGPTLGVNAAGSTNGGSFPASPVRDAEPSRGRSMQRFGNGPSPTSPRPHVGKSSPLARVAEETPTPIKVHTTGDANKPAATVGATGQVRTGKLVEVATPVETPDATPRHSGEYPKVKKGVDEVIDALSLGQSVSLTPSKEGTREIKGGPGVENVNMDEGRPNSETQRS